MKMSMLIIIALTSLAAIPTFADSVIYPALTCRDEHLNAAAWSKPLIAAHAAKLVVSTTEEAPTPSLKAAVAKMF